MHHNTISWNKSAILQVELIVNNLVPDWRAVGAFYRDVRDASNDKQLPPDIANMLNAALLRDALCGDEQFFEEPADLFIEFRSQGYYDPGSTYNPETAYPPEGEDERTLIKVRFEFGDDPKEIELSEYEQQQIFNYFEDEVNEYEID